jgi:uncharacterized protein DUF6920
MIWRAAVRMHGPPIRGSDSLVDGHGAMRWKLFGIVPIVHASGPDITRSAAGRVNIESIWLPSVLCSDAVSWTAPETSHAHAQFTAHNETAGIDYAIDEKGRLQSVNATLGQSRRLHVRLCQLRRSCGTRRQLQRLDNSNSHACRVALR